MRCGGPGRTGRCRGRQRASRPRRDRRSPGRSSSAADSSHHPPGGRHCMSDDKAPRLPSSGESRAGEGENETSEAAAAALASPPWSGARGPVTLASPVLMAWLSSSFRAIPPPVPPSARDSVFSSGRATPHVVRIASEAHPPRLARTRRRAPVPPGAASRPGPRTRRSDDDRSHQRRHRRRGRRPPVRAPARRRGLAGRGRRERRSSPGRPSSLPTPACCRTVR